MGRQSRKKKENRSESVGAARRNKLFDDYAKNLSAYRPEYKSQFACPLCLRLFERDSLSRYKITLEHCIPGKLGGTQLTLTCKDCNNRHGTKYDSHLVRWREYEDHVEGLSRKPHRATVIVGGSRLHASITNTGRHGPLALDVSRQRVDPNEMREAEAFMARFPQGLPSLDFQVRPGLDHRTFATAPAEVSVSPCVQNLRIWIRVAPANGSDSQADPRSRERGHLVEGWFIYPECEGARQRSVDPVASTKAPLLLHSNRLEDRSHRKDLRRGTPRLR